MHSQLSHVSSSLRLQMPAKSDCCAEIVLAMLCKPAKIGAHLSSLLNERTGDSACTPEAISTALVDTKQYALLLHHDKPDNMSM